jgi:hypothetical protein
VIQKRDIRGGPRFYPPGQHPAIQRHVLMLRRLEEFQRHKDTIEVSDTISYVKEQIAIFEQGEAEAKMIEYERQNRHRS